MFLLRQVVAPVVFVAVIATFAPAFADCPGACVPGGGPATTDCFLQFGGIAGTSVTCTDGDPSCDTDGTVDGVCSIALSACVNEPGSGCTSTGLSSAPTVKPLKGDAVTALSQELAALSLTDAACTAGPFKAPVKITLAGVKKGVTKLTFTAASGGKKDKDKLVITCNPGLAPSLATVVQPIFTAKCAIPTCHVGLSPSGELNMEDGQTYAQLAGKNAVSTLAHGLKDIEPGSLKKSYMARKVLGQGLSQFDSPMPQGCPVLSPCLTPEESATILTWIQGGAPNN